MQQPSSNGNNHSSRSETSSTIVCFGLEPLLTSSAGDLNLWYEDDEKVFVHNFADHYIISIMLASWDLFFHNLLC